MPKTDPPTPPVDPPANPPAPPANPPAPPDDEGARRREEVKDILAELAASGEIFGGPPSSDPSSGTPSPEGGSVDLEAAISRVLERRSAASKRQEKEQERDKTLSDLKEQVGKGINRVRRWFEPANPWGD